MKIQKRKFSFELESTLEVDGVNVYYGEPPLNYDSTKVVIEDIEDRIDDNKVITLTLPDDVPVSEGLQSIGVSTFDANGNESDIEAMQYFFDFTPPPKPKNLKIF